MRTTPAAGCSAFRKNQKGEFTQVKETTSFIAYEGAPKLPYPDSTSVKHKGVNDTCIDESHISQDRLVPIVPWEVSAKPSNDVSRGSFTAGYEKNANPDLYPQLPFKHWLLANSPTSQPLWVNFSMPTILDPFTNPPFSSITRCKSRFSPTTFEHPFPSPNPTNLADTCQSRTILRLRLPNRRRLLPLQPRPQLHRHPHRAPHPPPRL